tara:strand:+ start:2514 stop:6116 length:3603 start_codon:yes stop_codon:yes gene_type:complete
MGYMGSLFERATSGKIYKNLRETRNFEEAGYAFLYNLGQMGSIIPIVGPSFKNMGYEALQRYNDFQAFQKTGRFRNVTSRTLVYKVGGRLLSRSFDAALPQISGPMGRALRVGTGRVSAKLLSDADRKVRNFIEGNFYMDADKVTKKVTRGAMRDEFNIRKIQNSIVAIASANAPDYYAINRRNVLNRDSQSDEYITGMTFDGYSKNEIESMVSRMDMSRYVREKELPRVNDISDYIQEHRPFTVDFQGASKVIDPGPNARFSVQTLKHEEDGVSVMSLETFSRKRDAENFIRRNPDKIHTAANMATGRRELDMYSKNLTGYGPTYDFSGGGKTNDELISDAAAIVELAYLEKAGEIDAGSINNITLAIYDQLIDLAAQNVDLTSLGIASELRNLRGDVAELYGKELTKALHDDGLEPIKTGRARDKFDREPGGRRVTTRGSYTATFHDNPRRHNFVPNRQQIQKAIHALEPVLGRKNEIATYYVTFGGKSSKSRDADFLRDAFQIELGGPATDRQGGLFNRTDAYVYTPTLLMYKALHNTAMAFGLNKATSKPTMEGIVANKITTTTKSGGDSSSLVLRKSQIRAKGMSKPNRETRAVMEQLYMFSKKNSDGNIMTDNNGRFILSKSRLVDKHKKATLELVDDVLNDVLFGGGFIKGSKALDLGLFSQKPERVPFDKTYRGVPTSPQQIADEMSFLGFEEQRRMSAASKIGGSINDEDFKFVGQIVDSRPDSSKFIFESIDDGFGKEMFLIKAVKMEGRPVNYKSTKGLGGSKSASQGLASSQTLGTDAGMQLSNQLDGISPDDLLSFTGSVSGLNQVNRKLLIQPMKAEIEGKIIVILNKGNVLTPQERVMLARRFVQKLENDFISMSNDLSPVELARKNIRNLRRNNLTLREAGIRLSRADMEAFALAAETGLQQLSLQVTKVRKGAKTSIDDRARPFGPAEVVDASKVRRDADFTAGQQFAVFAGGDIDSIIPNIGTGTLFEEFRNVLAAALARNASTGEIERIKNKYRTLARQAQKEKARQAGVGLSDPDSSIVGGSKSARDIPNTGYASYGRTGEKPSGGQVGNITGQAGSGMNKRYALVLARSVQQDIQTYNLDRGDENLNARRNAYVAEQLKTIRDNPSYMKKLTEKLIANPNIRAAFSVVINSQQGRKGNRSVEDIRIFITEQARSAFEAEAALFEESQNVDFESDDLFED